MAKTKIIIIAEKGANKYDPGKMQGIGIKMYIINNRAGVDGIHEMRGKDSGPCHCYIIGKSPKYSETIEKAIRTYKVKWKIIRNCKNEDEIMNLEKKEFLKTVEESSKEKKKTRSKLQEEISDIKAIAPDLDEEDIACVIMAANEIEGMKIFPDASEIKKKAFGKMVLMYTQDDIVAEKGVEAYLKMKSCLQKR